MTEFEDENELRARLDKLKADHRALDREIDGGEDGPLRNQLMLSRLKRRKLALKDEIQRILDRLHPDIIA